MLNIQRILNKFDIKNSYSDVVGSISFLIVISTSPRKHVRDGDVIISTVRTYLQAIAPIQLRPDNLIVSTGFAVVRPKPDKLHSGYCKYALCQSGFIHEVMARSVGVTYPAIMRQQP